MEVIGNSLPSVSPGGGAVQEVLHDEREPDPHEPLSGLVLHDDHDIAPISVRHFIFHDVGRSLASALASSPSLTPTRYRRA